MGLAQGRRKAIRRELSVIPRRRNDYLPASDLGKAMVTANRKASPEALQWLLLVVLAASVLVPAYFCCTCEDRSLRVTA